MPNRLINTDLQILALNITSLGSVIAWVTENATGFGGGFVLFTVGILNLAKAYSTVKHGKREKDKK
tara:strand:+ start:78 stop:275 length:198 start_codon:yes stop_codon:yes gene_type:complete